MSVADPSGPRDALATLRIPRRDEPPKPSAELHGDNSRVEIEAIYQYFFRSILPYFSRLR